MDTQLLTSVIEGTPSQLEQDISHLNLHVGSWCINIHSVWAHLTTFQTFHGIIQISCNLSFVRQNSRNVIKTPLAVFFVDNATGKQFSHHHYASKRIPLSAQSDKLVFYLTGSDIIPDTAILGIHFSIERFL